RSASAGRADARGSRRRLCSLPGGLSGAREENAAAFRRSVAVQDADVQHERGESLDRGDLLRALRILAAVLSPGSSWIVAVVYRPTLHGAGGADALLRSAERLFVGPRRAAAAGER